jgi:hippurate hydrolase
VTENFGGYGLVGILRNGEGPTILVRTDMDALPVTEETGLTYASSVKAIDYYGNDVGVMHACGHDIHMSVWAGTARVLSKMKNNWKGTLLFIAQGAEEMGLGAKAMLDAGLFDKFPRPDYNLAIHDDPSIPAGSVALCPEYAMANVDMVNITVFGIGGHGALPHTTIDPVVIASRIVLDLQTIISRELSPLTPAVITVGKISGGTVGNVIPEKVEMQLTVRSFSDEVRSAIFEKIERTCLGIAMASGVPEDKLPVVTVKDQFTPSLYNDPDLTDRMKSVFNECLGHENVFDSEPRMIGEDFSRYGRQDPPIPSLMFRLGTTNPGLYERAEKGEAEISGLHSSKFAPDYSLTIKTGVIAMSAAALELLNSD